MVDEIKTPDPVPVPAPKPEVKDDDILNLPTKMDHAVRWGMVLVGIVLASLGSLYPNDAGMPQWVRVVMVVGGTVMTTFKALGFNVLSIIKK
jgi:hypothetical protein